ncbi:MAG TPA: PSD1 and planctomycete cytochrome C domain-containing protein [Planctomycetota bacterium]|nr:PSD1 and planctomycete cytochrome C domain-containing protein [Planctomycetota bacterium]
MSATAPPPRYDRDIRPILADRCFRCHGPDAQKRKADLRLDERAGAVATLKHGEHAIVPSDLEHSELWRRINAHDPDEQMPPADSGKKALTAAERGLLQRWILSGADYEPHWSFVPPQQPPLPVVRDVAWCRTGIDRFVLARLEQEGVAPATQADKATLVRRLFLVITGLPPTPEESDAFLADARPDALVQWLRRLLAEEPYRSRYAERMAVPWLDQARYADTCGIHTDAGRQMWAYRDWVLAALRDHMPFDQFVREQLAGDLLREATPAQKVASGFNRCHVTTDEGGAISDEYLVEYAVDRTATMGSVFLGLTLGCARCHEHKYDPISQEDFYRLYAYFDSIEEPGLYSQEPDSNRAFEPFLPVPSAAQSAEQLRLTAGLAAAKTALDTPVPAEDAQQQAFFADLEQRTGLHWAAASVVAAQSTGGSALTIEGDGAVFASGANPGRDEHEITLRTEAEDLRLLCLEALADPRLPNGRVGRAPNGNAVLTGVRIEAQSLRDPGLVQTVRTSWAWASLEQQNGDHNVVNALSGDDARGWAVDAHNVPGNRVALLLAEQPFGFPGGTELHVHLLYRSVYSQHVFGRVRLSVGSLSADGAALLPEARSRWYVAGAYPVARDAAFSRALGPELLTTLDHAQKFDGKTFRFDESLRDDRVNRLADGTNIHYVAQEVFAPTPRERELSLGSDDGFRLFLGGKQVAAREVERAAAADQDRAKVEFAGGRNLLVMKIANTGGAAGFYCRTLPRSGELAGDLVAALLPPLARTAELQQRLQTAWRLQFSPGYQQRRQHLTELQQQLAELDKNIPRTMVMKELAQARPTFVLMRGAYDKPDPQRRVDRGVPAALGKLPPGAPADRRGLADWLLAADNPLLARVSMNRLWELAFGTGIVRTSDDFGMQGEWPSHPELLDWLAVEFRSSGWDIPHMLELLLGSAAWQQSSVARPDVAARDPDNRWLSWYPRRRLPAELLRDQALYVSGLLVEKFGGPSVKPYQPDGLWQEVAMPASNTRRYQRGMGDELWRRSLYTYWKRACPPPNLQAFDAPTREFCTVRRMQTNTPLQALVLWNDEQFVEAARKLAERTLLAGGDDDARLQAMYRRCTARLPDDRTLARVRSALATWRQRYATADADARALLAVGQAPPAGALPPAELAAWTMVASALFALDATLCTD